jgi:CheY-like chemotaxis protein
MARILVVDDERDVAELISFMFQREGHSCAIRHNGKEALAEMGLEPSDDGKPLPDLVILDVMMPVMDGYAVCARMHEDSRTKSIPILMLTARGNMRDLLRRSPNVAAHLDKPFDPKALRQLVGAMLEGTR